MASLCLMYWTPKQKRWMKEYRGKTYSVSCRQLKCPPTKEESRQFANSWWEKKQEEIDRALGEAKKHPPKVARYYSETIENWRMFGKWNRKYGDTTEAQRADAMIEWLNEALKSDNPPYPLTKLQEMPLWKDERDLDLDDVEAFQVMWMERFAHIYKEEQAEQATPAENTIQAHAQDYLSLKKAQAGNKKKIGTYFSAKQWLEVFTKWIDPYLPVADINEVVWEKFYIYLSSKVASGDYSPATAKDYLGAARAFIRNRWEKQFIPNLPRNLNSKDLVFTVPDKDPIVFDVKEEIKPILDSASGRTRLYVLLMLNCGMYPKDIAVLAPDEIIWETGRIYRKRTKTRDRSKKVPKVNYLLWKETRDLLKEAYSQRMKLFPDKHPEFALLNEDGNPLWSEHEVDGKWKRNNAVKCSFFRLLNKMKLSKDKKKPLKSLRKTGATLLENSEYGRFSEHYLGEAPHTTASRHYSHKNGEEFDQAIMWLGTRLGLAEEKTPKKPTKKATKKATDKQNKSD